MFADNWCTLIKNKKSECTISEWKLFFSSSLNHIDITLVYIIYIYITLLKYAVFLSFSKSKIWKKYAFHVVQHVFFLQCIVLTSMYYSSSHTVHIYFEKSITFNHRIVCFSSILNVVLYLFVGNDLFYVRLKDSISSRKVKVVKGAEEAERIFIDFHASPTGAHCGQIKTTDAISRRFYWPGMSVDIKKWVC